MKNKYITQSEYEKQLAQEEVFVNCCIGFLAWSIGLTLFWMSLL